MISYQEAIQIIDGVIKKENNPEQSFEEIDLLKSVDRILATDIISENNIPEFNQSNMDGFAVQHKDVINIKNGEKIKLKVLRCIAAGDLPPNLNDQQCAIEIMTGAPLPSNNFNTIIKIEDVLTIKDKNGNVIEIEINKTPNLNEHIRFTGDDVKKGEIILKAGTIIKPQHVLALAALGKSQIKVKKTPKILLLSTGAELVEYNQELLSKSHIRNSTAPYIQTFLMSKNIAITYAGIVGDDLDKLSNFFLKSGEYDLIITTGAVSMGKFDFIRPALEKIKAKIHFHKCAIRPGKPILFAEINHQNNSTFVFSLPGNPISTMVGMNFFIMPFLSKLYGFHLPEKKPAQLTKSIKKPEGFRCFYKAHTKYENNKLSVTPLDKQALFMVTNLNQTNSWVILPEDKNEFNENDYVEVCEL